MRLSELTKGGRGTVLGVHETHPSDAIARRLRDLGFVPGESFRVVARAPMGGDPMLVQIGSTRFALRRTEAARVGIDADTVA